MLVSSNTTIQSVGKHKALTFLEEAVAGLSATNKSIPCKYFYDRRGSLLFDQICELPEYYPTRTELSIMKRFAGQMVEAIGERNTLIEYGSGSSSKTRILLDNAQQLATYVPVDISREHLFDTSDKLRRVYPNLEILPVCADYTHEFELPDDGYGSGPAAIYFPGSTIGNFHLEEAKKFLEVMRELCGEGGGLLIGVDLIKDISVLERAYNDISGITAAFNKNVLLRINNELNGMFDVSKFDHRAFFDPLHHRIEMHLVSSIEQEAWIGSTLFHFAAGETIWTESSYKYSLAGFADLAGSAGWAVEHVWTDPENLFSVQFLTVV